MVTTGFWPRGRGAGGGPVKEHRRRLVRSLAGRRGGVGAGRLTAGWPAGWSARQAATQVVTSQCAARRQTPEGNPTFRPALFRPSVEQFVDDSVAKTAKPRKETNWEKRQTSEGTKIE